MSNDDLTPVGDAEIRIAIEIGDNAHTTQRVKDAIGELADALAEAGDDDVSGFALTSLESGSLRFFNPIGVPVENRGTVGQKQEPYLKY